MMRIETTRLIAGSIHLKVNSSQSPVWWGLKPLLLVFSSLFFVMIPASRQYDEDWNCFLVRTFGHCFLLFQPVASMMRIETPTSICSVPIYVIPASRQYDEDWNKCLMIIVMIIIYSSQSPVWWGLKQRDHNVVWLHLITDSSQSPVWWGLKPAGCWVPISSFHLFQPVASMMRIETRDQRPFV